MFLICKMSYVKMQDKYHIIQNNYVDLKNVIYVIMRATLVWESGLYYLLTKGFRYTMLLKMISVVYRKPLVGDGGIVYKLINFQTQDSDNVHTEKNLYDFVWMRLIYVAYKWLTYSNLKISFISFFFFV